MNNQNNHIKTFENYNNDNNITIDFGKYKGKTLNYIYENDINYLLWLACNVHKIRKKAQEFYINYLKQQNEGEYIVTITSDGYFTGYGSWAYETNFDFSIIRPTKDLEKGQKVKVEKKFASGQKFFIQNYKNTRYGRKMWDSAKLNQNLKYTINVLKVF